MIYRRLWARHLLRNTMNVATAEQNFASINRLDNFVWEKFLEGINCLLVVLVMENR